MRDTENTMVFNNIVKEYYAALVFFAGRMVGSSAPELVQDIFLKLWQRWEKFETPEKVKAFLYISTRNSCYNHLRDKRTRQHYEEAWASMAPDTEEDISFQIIRTEVLREVAQAIEQLPDQCRTVIRMMYTEGKSTDEVSQALGISPSTVRSQKARGISLLRKMLSSRAMSLILALLP